MAVEQFVVTNYMLAPLELRVANFVLDLIIRVVIFAILVILLDLLFFNEGLFSLADWVDHMDKGQELLFGFVTMFIYYLATEALFARSFGKYVTGTIVVMEDGSKPDFQTILIRTANRLIPFEFLTFLQNGARGWHDSNSRTYVVKKKRLQMGIKKCNTNSILDTNAELTDQML